MDKNIEIITFGCRLNTYESEAMKEMADEVGLENAIIFNTCAVTAEAERQARQAIRRARRENADAKIIVTGCAAQINPKLYADMPEVDKVLGNMEKMDKSTFSNFEQVPKIHVQDIMAIKETAGHMVTSFDGISRAFVEIQNGCNHRCTFCTIPFGRGNNRSVPMGVIVDQVRQLVHSGFEEIVFTGVDITDYGSDLPGKPTLGQMTKRLLAQVPELKRLRLSSLDPVEVDEDIFHLIENESRLMPHFHISLQAGHDLTLKRMKRRHLRHHIIEFCERVRRYKPDAVFGADIIVGFPTETEEMFQGTLSIVDVCDLTYLHVFPYSPRPGTPAARMPQVPKSTIKDRASRLRAKGDEVLQKHLSSQIGRTLPVLVENETTGRTNHYAVVKFSSPTDQKPGTVATVKITSATPKNLVGDIVNE